jgi:hypothetical protein
VSTTLPGIKAKHAVITPTCRLRGDEVVIDEALARLRSEFLAIVPHWPAETSEFHVVLTVSPKEPDDPEKAQP